MRTVIKRNIDDLDIGETSWVTTVSASEIDTVFQTYQWFHSWWQTFGHQQELFFISVHDGEELVGFAPMMISTAVNGERVLRFVGDTKADYLDFVIKRDKPRVLENIFSTLFEQRGYWDRIWLKNVPGHSTTLAHLRNICLEYEYKHIVENNVQCPALVIQGREQEAADIASKYSLRRPYNKISRLGKIRFRHLTDMAESLSYLDTFFQQHIQRWSITESPSLFLDSQIQVFYRNLLQQGLPKGWLLFSIVELGEHPLAFHYGFDYNGKVIWYKPSFDIALSRHSPGLVLLKNLIDYSIANGRHEFDFTIGNEAFKDRYSNEMRHNADISIFKRPGRYYFETVMRGSRRFLKHALRGEI